METKIEDSVRKSKGSRIWSSQL